MKQVGNLLVIDFTNSAGVSLKVNSLMNHYKHTLEIISTTRENKGSPLHSQPPKSKPAIPKETTLLEDLTAL